MAKEFYFQPPAQTDLDTLIAAFADEYNYQDEIILEDETTIPNSQTKEEFMRERVEEYLLNVALAYRARCFDNGPLTAGEYSLGRKGYLSAVAARSRDKIKLNQRDVYISETGRV